jgi:starch-binding outer membrane protein, SusD/RagB family
MKNINIVLFLLILTFSMVSCSDFLDEGPQSTMTSEQVFSKVENIDPYMLGLYNQWRGIHKGRGGIYYGTDEAALGGVQARDNAERYGLDAYTGMMNSTNSIVLSEWTSRYNVIAAAAIAIKELKPREGESDEINKLLAEACFLRAVNYFELVMTWGGVPLIDYDKMEQYGTARQTLDVLYPFIISDFELAIKYLPDPSDASYTDHRRATKPLAQALLGKLYLYAPENSGLRDYAKAEELFKAVYENPYYGGTGALDFANIFDVYQQGSTDYNHEIVYAFQFSNVRNDNSGAQWDVGSRAVSVMTNVEAIVYFSGFDHLLPTEYCYSTTDSGGVWEEGDVRKDLSIRYDFTYNGQQPQLIGYCYGDELDPHIKKYEDPRTQEQGLNTWYSGKNIPFIRFSDVILCYAECLYFTGQQADAINMINMLVRRRAFGGRITSEQKWPTSLSEDEFVSHLLDERLRELCFEGWRKMDLIRFGKIADYTLTRNKWAKQALSFQDFNYLWPIPLDEINKNTDMSVADQNPGY